MEWRERFDKEMMEKSKVHNKRETVLSGSKLTGKSCFTSSVETIIVYVWQSQVESKHYSVFN